MTTKRFLKLQIIFIILLTLTFASSTLAWAPRPKVTGGGFMISSSTDSKISADDKAKFTAMQLVTPEKAYFVNGTGCTAETYTGIYDASTGHIIYGDSEESPSQSINKFTPPAGGVAPGSVFYFKTVITNDTNADANISLFINGKFTQDFGTDFILSVTSPVVTDDAITVIGNPDSQGYHHFKLSPIVRSFEINAKGTANVEWYLINNSSEAGDFAIESIILTNN